MPPKKGVPQKNRNRIPVEEIQPFIDSFTKAPHYLTYENIALCAGVSARTITNIMVGRVKFVNPGTVRAIQEANYVFDWEEIDQRSVSALGTCRRLRALAVYGGWSPADLEKETGVNQRLLVRIRNRGAKRTAPYVTAAVREAYDRLWDKQSPNWRAYKTKEYAEKMKWAPPAAWDEETIELPQVRPKGVVRYKPRQKKEEAA